MTLKPLPPSLIVAARLRQRAEQLILDAEELEAPYTKYTAKTLPTKAIEAIRGRINKGRRK